ncbi:hypothetical protein [Lysobacter gummosus]|uniref:hypothetical protein n=1 Tax=Lysobacter gummosus TaxID=262324 RepID=UPI00362B49EF
MPGSSRFRNGDTLIYRRGRTMFNHASLMPSFPRRRESSDFRARTFEVTGFPPSRE